MTQTAFVRDNILTFQERQDAARKCLGILENEIDRMSNKERDFVIDMGEKIETSGCSERQLAWLRDLTEKYD